MINRGIIRHGLTMRMRFGIRGNYGQSAWCLVIPGLVSRGDNDAKD